MTRSTVFNAVPAEQERGEELTRPKNSSVLRAPARGAIGRAMVRSTTVAATVVAFFAACGSSDGGPPIPLDDFGRLLVDAICSNIGPCCQEAGFPHDAAQCQSTAQNELRSFIDENRSPNVTYDADAARKCVDVYTATIRACRDPQRQVNAVCRFVFAGTLQPGQPCTSSQECVAGMSCSPSPDGGAKQCTGWPEVRGKLGDGCHATCTEAENGTSCGSGGSTGPGDAGAPGDAGMPGDAGAPGTATCYTNDGLYCDGAHACARQPALDQPCTFTTTCAGEAFCDNGVCVPKRTSGPCGELNDGCAVTAYCDLTTRQCALRKSIGDPCSSGAECAVTDTCAAGTCRERTIATRSLCNGNL